MKIVLILLLFNHITACKESNQHNKVVSVCNKSNLLVNYKIDTNAKCIHVFVALCDNKYQGIVPVNEKVGNGQDPINNLYWGWGYGVKTFFKNSKEWEFIKSEKPSFPVLERVIFKYKFQNYFLVADAYDGRNMKECLTNYFNSLSGQLKDTLSIDKKILGTFGNSRLLVFIGHNGLMDFNLAMNFHNTDSRKRDCIALACYSKIYFTPHLKQAMANPILFTNSLMGPEAYTLHDALTGYIKSESSDKIKERASLIYSKYTKCSVKSAKKIFTTGW
jgi:hypothetical protein